MSALDLIEARANAATDGPWVARTTGRSGGDHWYVCDQNQSVASIHASDGEDEDQRQPDAEFIADARTDVPRLVAALRAALDLHKPVSVYEYDDMNGVFKLDDVGEQVEMKTLCSTCTGDSVLELIGDCEYDDGDYHDETIWPCPTYAAITTALEDQ